MKFQKNGGKIGIPKKKSYEIQKKWEKKLEFQKKILMKFQKKNPQVVRFQIDLLINFEKILRSKETSYQNSKNHMPSASL